MWTMHLCPSLPPYITSPACGMYIVQIFEFRDLTFDAVTVTASPYGLQEMRMYGIDHCNLPTMLLSDVCRVHRE